LLSEEDDLCLDVDLLLSCATSLFLSNESIDDDDDDDHDDDDHDDDDHDDDDDDTLLPEPDLSLDVDLLLS
jgi:hypothetical protein